MSTVMYSYRVDKSDWWDVATRIRAFYLTEFPMIKAMKAAADAMFEGGKNRYQTIKFLDAIADGYTRNPDESWSVELQVFDAGADWHLRPLERNHFMLNHYEQFPELRPVFFDNRSDVPEHQEPNREIAVWVDEQIDAHRYFIFEVLSREDYRRVGIDKLFALWDLAKAKEVNT